jgi:hypothetical protein
MPTELDAMLEERRTRYAIARRDHCVGSFSTDALREGVGADEYQWWANHEAGTELARRLIQAITGGNEAEWRSIAAILPADLKSKVVLAAEREKTRAALEKELG